MQFYQELFQELNIQRLMSRLNDIVSACESPEQVKNILEAMGSG